VEEGARVLLLTIQPERIPPCFKSSETDALNLRELWAEYVSERPATYDDNAGEWLEEALRLKTSLLQFGPENIALRIFGNKTFYARNLATGELYSKSGTKDFDVYGFNQENNNRDARYEQSRLANSYAFYDSFTQHAGRKIVLGGFNSEQNDLVNTLYENSLYGEQEFYVKLVEPKAGIFKIALPVSPSRSEVEDAVFSQMSWHLSKIDCRENTLTIQECIPLKYEYRFFIIDGQLVAGAGCIEEFSYTNHQGKQFDTQLRSNRQYASPVCDNQLTANIISEYIDFARNVVHDFSEEVSELKNYTLDVALGRDGKPVVIELNDFLSSGLYASDVFAITRAYADYLGYDRR
jgi:hypothetical protein